MPDPDRVAQRRALLLLFAGRSRIEICEELGISDEQLTRWEESTPTSDLRPEGLPSRGAILRVRPEGSEGDAMNWGPRVVSFGRSGSEPRRCSFCGRREEAVQHLVRVRGAYICDRCVAQAHEAIASAPPGQRLLRVRPTPGRVGDTDAAEEAIERAFETAFSSEIPIAERCQAIERGTNLAATMEEVRARYAPAQNVDVSVDYVRFVSEDEAEVHFALLLSQFGPSGLTQTGHAVLVDGEWKVSRDTWCRLVSLAGVQCPPPED